MSLDHGDSNETRCLEEDEKIKRMDRQDSLAEQIFDILNGWNLLAPGFVDINWELLRDAIDDYFEDIKRMKLFHKIDLANVNKIYGYEIYWILRRKPIQIVNQKIPEEFRFINEKVCVALLISWFTEEMGVITTAEKIKRFSDLLYYNFKYRLCTQQSLELLLEAMSCGLTAFEKKIE